MKYQNFWMYFAFGAIIGWIVGIMKEEIAIWLIVGAILGFLVALLFETKTIKNKLGHDKIMWIGFFFLFPIMFFSNYLEGSFCYDVFGILAVIGAFTLIVNFVKMRREMKVKKKTKVKKK